MKWSGKAFQTSRSQIENVELRLKGTPIRRCETQGRGFRPFTVLKRLRAIGQIQKDLDEAP